MGGIGNANAACGHIVGQVMEAATIRRMQLRRLSGDLLVRQALTYTAARAAMETSCCHIRVPSCPHTGVGGWVAYVRTRDSYFDNENGANRTNLVSTGKFWDLGLRQR